MFQSYVNVCSSYLQVKIPTLCTKITTIIIKILSKLQCYSEKALKLKSGDLR